MKSIILALATAVPAYHQEQTIIAQRMIEALQLESKTASFITKLYERSAIKTRYSVLPDFERQVKDWTFYGPDVFNMPGMHARNEIYKQEAPQLAKEVALKALTLWGQPKEEITHIISVSCTGVTAPGIEFLVQQELGLQSNVQRYGINMMGCFGAFRALALADALAQKNHKNRILIVCTELCSLHFQIDGNPEILVGNALFGDGAAAAVVGTHPQKDERALFALNQSRSLAFDNTQDKMTWNAGDTGFVMTLSAEIPRLIREKISDFSQSLLEKNSGTTLWAIHPGGKKILQEIESACNLSKTQTQASWSVLENYGNMSSATFLFVLDELYRQTPHTNQPVIGLGFGPGLSIEGISLIKDPHETAQQ